ncbi:MAG: 3-isopropylmalate dehydratase small subunit [Spirochaetota bacterium]|nr:MAG: 3-isopropylmalate dehydratase small subunit [Spirochaetota bacterium]
MSKEKKLSFEGRAHRYGDNIDTDAIIPARYLNTTDELELASHCMEDLEKDFSKKVNKGDIIIAGENFGCGSSREHAPIAIKASGISCVIAASFARIFYRNAINIGLAILECREASKNIATGELVKIDLATGTIENLSTGTAYSAEPFPPFMQEIINAGGLINSVKKKMEEQK